MNFRMMRVMLCFVIVLGMGASVFAQDFDLDRGGKKAAYFRYNDESGLVTTVKITNPNPHRVVVSEKIANEPLGLVFWIDAYSSVIRKPRFTSQHAGEGIVFFRFHSTGVDDLPLIGKVSIFTARTMSNVLYPAGPTASWLPVDAHSPFNAVHGCMQFRFRYEDELNTEIILVNLNNYNVGAQIQRVADNGTFLDPSLFRLGPYEAKTIKLSRLWTTYIPVQWSGWVFVSTIAPVEPSIPVTGYMGILKRGELVGLDEFSYMDIY